MIGSGKEQTQSEELVLEELESSLILYNDDVNTFDYVIDCLVEICRHNPIQAEQITHIVHYNGKCEVKQGTKKELISMCKALINCGLQAEVN
ncbi:ATP-dependent Clp protease adaptor ClpS [bacterium SCSIO 12741]|nr:ATP-dependent Clp protease adaptor ClpS [bacterium SCSIO 12741]